MTVTVTEHGCRVSPVTDEAISLLQAISLLDGPIAVQRIKKAFSPVKVRDETKNTITFDIEDDHVSRFLLSRSMQI